MLRLKHFVPKKEPETGFKESNYLKENKFTESKFTDLFPLIYWENKYAPVYLFQNQNFSVFFSLKALYKHSYLILLC